MATESANAQMKKLRAEMGEDIFKDYFPDWNDTDDGIEEAQRSLELISKWRGRKPRKKVDTTGWNI
jgi:hypothetical protein